ncbi:carboxypeptidase-like regulatory domain-containing protein [Deinococcus sp. PEB2-67]
MRATGYLVTLAEVNAMTQDGTLTVRNAAALAAEVAIRPARTITNAQARTLLFMRDDYPGDSRCPRHEELLAGKASVGELNVQASVRDTRAYQGNAQLTVTATGIGGQTYTRTSEPGNSSVTLAVPTAPVGAYTVTVSAPGFTTQSRIVNVAAGSGNPVTTVALDPNATRWDMYQPFSVDDGNPFGGSSSTFNLYTVPAGYRLHVFEWSTTSGGITYAGTSWDYTWYLMVRNFQWLNGNFDYSTTNRARQSGNPIVTVNAGESVAIRIDYNNLRSNGAWVSAGGWLEPI